MRLHFPTIDVVDFTQSKQTKQHSGVVTYYTDYFIVQQQVEVLMVVIYCFFFCNDVTQKFSLLLV